MRSRSFSLKVIALSTGLIILIGAGTAWYLYEQQYSITRIVAVCAHETGNDKAICYNNGIATVLDHSGLRAAFNLVAVAYSADPKFEPLCHNDMHTLGAAAYKQFSETGHIDLTDQTSDCGYGFYHGFMNEMVYETGSLVQAQSFCAYVGQVLGGDQEYAEGSCYHGIGHGVTDGVDPSTWGNAGKMAAPGLVLCNEVSTSTDYRFRCDTGVFNSIAIMYRDPEYELNARGQPYALCETPTYTSYQKEACYEQMNTVADLAAGDDFAQALLYPAKIADPYYRDLAIKNVAATTHILGSNESSTSLPPPVIAAACNIFSGDDLTACVQGLVDYYMEYGTPGSEYKDAIAFCEAVDFAAPQERTCTQEVVVYSTGIYPPSKQKTVCESIPADLAPTACSRIVSAATSSSGS